MSYPNDTRVEPGPHLRVVRGDHEYAVTLYEDSALRGTRYFDPPANDPRRLTEPTHDRFVPDPDGFQDLGKFGPFNLFGRALKQALSPSKGFWNVDAIVKPVTELTADEVRTAYEAERHRHEKAMDTLLTRASELKVYIPGADPFRYPGAADPGGFRAAHE